MHTHTGASGSVPPPVFTMKAARWMAVRIAARSKTGVARRRAIARSASSVNTLSSGFGLPLSYFAQKLSRS